ncbi:hypothetical protein KAU33_04385 [Candidatus Dependentiae bacterium]|nr:hypothetical protein [Candidatus Dependentiae bacterium]
MLEKVKPIDVLNHPEGLEVMGKTKECDVFKGTVVKVVQYDHELPKFVMVEGTIHNGRSSVPFGQIVTCDKLKIFDEDVFDIAVQKVIKYVVYIESAEDCKRECEELLS